MIIRNQLNVTISTELPDNYRQKRLADWESNAESWSTYINNEGNRRMLIHNIAKSVAEINQNVPARILDLGVGEGMFLRSCRNHMPHAELFGIDFSQPILNIAEKKSTAVRITFILGDFESEELNLNEQFDIVTAIFTFDEASNLDSSFAAVSKHLKLNGKAVIVILDPVLESFRYNNLKTSDAENGKSPRLIHISKHFYAKRAISPAPYHRIVRPVTDYTAAAKKNGLDLLSLKPIPFGSASIETLVGPVADVLIFEREDVL